MRAAGVVASGVVPAAGEGLMGRPGSGVGLSVWFMRIEIHSYPKSILFGQARYSISSCRVAAEGSERFAQ